MLMASKTREELERWEVSRERTFILFCFFLGLIGMEYSIVVPTLLTYLRDVIKVEHEAFWFGFIQASYSIFAMVGNFTITKYTDRTRNIKEYFYVGFFVASLGNFLYTIPYSVVYPLVGRSMQGLGDALQSVVFGEVLRIYPEKQAVKKMSYLVSFYYVTFLIGPAFSLIFSKVDTLFFGIQLTIVNVPTLVIAFLWFICIPLNWFFMKNLSKEYDMKEEMRLGGMLSDEDPDSNQHDELTFQRLVSFKEIRIILSINFLCTYAAVANYDTALPFVCATYYKMKVQTIALLFSATGIVFLLTLVFVLSKINLQNNEIYVIIVGLTIFIIAMQSMALSALLSHLRYIGLSFLALYTITNGTSWSLEQVLLGVTVGKMILSRHQSYVEGVRRALSSFGRITGGFLTPVLHNYLVEQLNIFSSILFLIVIYLFVGDLKFTVLRI